MGASGLENRAIGAEPIGVRFLYFPRKIARAVDRTGLLNRGTQVPQVRILHLPLFVVGDVRPWPGRNPGQVWVGRDWCPSLTVNQVLRHGRFDPCPTHDPGRGWLFHPYLATSRDVKASPGQGGRSWNFKDHLRHGARACSSNGRAPAWLAGGSRFESGLVHGRSHAKSSPSAQKA